MDQTKSLPLPLASVIIPVYNKSATVARTIASVKAQTLSNLEAIIVDDGSTDNSKDVVLEAIKDDRRFRYIHQNNSRVAAARNRGFRESKGIYICCLDGDDAIAPTFLEVCVKALMQDPSLGIAYTGLHYVLPDGKEGDSPWPGEFNYDDSLAGKTQIPTCNVAKREVWERTGGQRGRYCVYGAGEEDAEMWLRVGALGWNAKKVTNECLFIYSWQSGQVSGNPQHKMSDYRAWHPWVQDGRHPFASMAKPKKHSHEVMQYDEPVVSIVIPCGPNHAQYLPDALDSLEAQTFRKWEAIVVCDGFSIPDDLQQAFPFVRWTECTKRGAGAARNLGASKARGTFLLFLDADDWLRPNAITRMLQAWQQEPAIIYSDYAGHAYIDSQTEIQKLQMRGRLESYNEKTKEAIVLHQAFDYDCEQAVQQPRLYKDGQFYIWSLITSLTPKRWHDEIGGFDESMKSWEDWDYWLRMARAGKCFTRIMEPLVDYRFYSGTRRETGRQIHESLLQYMTEKYKEQKAMPCGSCGKKRAAPPPAETVPAMSPQMSGQMSADNIVWVRLTDGNLGQHPIVGVATKTNYGYRAHGDLFKMHTSDIAAAPHRYTVTADPNAVPVNATVVPVATVAEPPKPIATPGPVKAVEFAKWPEPKKAGRPKKKVA